MVDHDMAYTKAYTDVGTPMTKTRGRPARPLTDRIMDSIVVDGSDCWVWRKAKNAGGYGMISLGSRNDGTRRTEYAHRASYEAFVGPIPDGKVVDHVCRNSACVNPKHLEAVTQVLNAIRRSAANSGYRVCRNGHRQPEGVIECKPCQGKLFT